MADARSLLSGPTSKHPGRVSTPGVLMWQLQKDGRVLRCELHDERRTVAGVDVQILNDDYRPLITRRSPDWNGAVFVAVSVRRDFVRNGWKD